MNRQSNRYFDLCKILLISCLFWVSVLSFTCRNSSGAGRRITFSVTAFHMVPISSIPMKAKFTTFQSARTPMILFGKKQKTKKSQQRATRTKMGKRTASSSGFGGAAVEDCPCGSTLAYMKCCGKIHKDADAFAQATPEQVVRARYSAYAKREIDFIIGSTHPLNEAFMSDIEHWRETIRTNCYDNFELTKCEIRSESFQGEGESQVGKVKFIANMIQVDSREMTSFMEISTFERAGKHIRQGAWLYRSGVVESVPDDNEGEISN